MQNTEDRKWLYEQLKDNGYDIGSQEEFESSLDNNEEDAKWYHEQATSLGLEVGNYEDFGSLFRNKPQGYTLDEMKAASIRDYDRERHSAAPEPSKGKETVWDGKIDVPNAPKLTYGEVDNKEYLTPAESMRKMMAQGVKQRQQVADMTANIQQSLDKRGAELDEQAKQSAQNFVPRGTAGSVAGFDAGRMVDSEYRDYAAAKEALDNAQKLMDEAVVSGKDENNKGLFKGFLKGAERGLNDLDSNDFTFGLKDASENLALLQALDAADEDKATPSQQALLDAVALNMATEAGYGSMVGRGYKAGQVTGQAIPFMVEMAINPLSKAGKSVANRVARHYIKKYLGNEVLEQAAKKGTKYALTRIAPRAAQVVGDIAGAAGMAATTGAANVTADAFKRMQGDVKYDYAKDGSIKYDGHTEGDDLATAFAKAYASSTIENFSEMLGNYFAPISNAASKGITKGLSKVGLDKVNSFIKEVSANDLALLVSDFENHANWNGTMGEFAEEIAGGVLNSIIVGDQTLGEVFDKDNLIDTALGVSLLGGIMSSAKTMHYPVYKYQAQSNIKKAKIPFDNAFGVEDKAAMEIAFNDSDPRVAGNKLREIVNSEDYTEEQKKAAANYAKTIQMYKGAKLMDDKRFNAPDVPQEEKDVEVAYDKGRTLETTAEMTDANNMYEIALAEIREHFEMGEDTTEDDIKTLLGGNLLKAAFDVRESEPKLSDLILNLAYATATRDGIIDAARDRISEESAQAEAIIDYRKNKDDGMIHPATLKTKDANGNDRQVYVVSGNIVTFEDGTINTQESDNDIIIQDAVTGKPEFATAKDLLRAEQALDPEVEKQNVRNTIADTIATEVENKMNNVLPFNVGDAYNIIGADGAEHSVQVMADNGDGSVMASIDNAEAVAMPKSEIQQLSNEYNMARARLANEAQKEAKQSEKMKQESQNVESTNVVEQTTETPAEVVPERVVPTLKDGNPDFNAMDAEMFVDEYVSRYGEDSAVKIARKNISNARENIAKIDKKIDDITDPNQMEGLYVQRKSAEAQIARYSDILDRLGASEDAAETEADQRNRLRNDAGNRIATLFPDGMPNVESFILADIATGNRIRWSDKVTNGVVTSRGLGAELGLSDSKQERTRRLPLIGKDAMTPEEYAESLRERLDAAGIRFDESSLRDAVLDVYQSVDSRKGAWDALENIAKRGAEQEVDTDWESMQQERAYNKAQEVAENTPELPSLDAIEEETPISEGEYAEMEAQAQAEEQKDYDAMMAENQPINEAEATPVITLSDEKIEFQNKIQEWLSPENVSWAEGKDLSDSIEKFGNEVEPIAILPEIVRGLFPEVSSLYLYSGKGYLIDHAANHHPELSADEYNKIQEVLDSYDDIKDVSTPKTKKIAFVKMLDKGFAVVAELTEKDGKIMLHKTFFYKDAQGKRVPYKNKPSLLKESSVDGSTTISPAESAAGRHRNISALDASSESKDTTSEPQKQEVDEKISQEEAKVNTNPTDGQKEAGNYKKGHVVVDGFNITIEQPKGSVRSGVDADGKEWSITMNNTYGYIRGTEGVDGDHIDVFLSDNLDNWSGEVFVVDQINTDGSFDEHKVMYGFNSIEEAQQAYLSNYSEGWQGLGAITGVSKDEFKKWIESSHRKTKPFAEYKSVKATEGQSAESVEAPDDEQILFRGGEKSVQEEVTETIFATAKEKFGTTYDMREAGYILPDGSMLDFSGKHEIRGADTSFLNGQRSVDHRAIQEIAYDFDENKTGVETDMGDFLDRGAIRIDYNTGAINLNVAPTKAQKDRLKRLIERNDGDVYIDFGKGWDTEHYVEYESARASRVLADIDRYFNEGIKPSDSIRFRSAEPAPVFYSNAEYAVKAVKQEKATPEQWLKMIEKNGGLKAGEDKWLGLSDWLKSSDKKTLTKQEVLDFIKENQIQIEEVEYAENPQGFEELKKEYDGWLRDGGYDYAWDKLIERYGYDSTVAFDDVGGELVVQYGNTASKLLGGEVSTIKSTRLDYTTNGLDNKREIALTVPTIESWNESDEIHFGDAGNGRAIAWVRFGETTDADGNRVLVIDEIQSKRHQEGREKGYQDSKRIKEATQRFNALADEKVALVKEILHENGFAHYTDEDNSLFTEKAQRDAEMGKMGSEEQRKKILDISRAMMEAAKEYNASSGIPEAPFEKNWAELAMKRMLRYAAENGFDKVAWTTGEQQAERYDISKSVDNIKSEDNNVEETADGTLIVKNITIYAGGSVHNLFVDANGIVRGREYDGKKLSDIVGKPLAEKLMEKGDFELEGDGLRIGGEGMKAFYDQMIPSFMNKYGKKWGVKVGEVTMPSLEENNTMHSIDVTDAMRESVMQGQPMFRTAKSNFDSQFAELQTEYDALDKNDTETLNSWRDKKADVVRSYVNWVSDKFGLKCELYVFNGGREEEMRKAYDTMVEKYKAEGIEKVSSYESFKKKVSNPKVVATHRKSINFVTFNTSAKDAELDIEQFAETLFHENAHRIAQGMYSKQEFEQIWENAKKSKNHIAKSVEKLYSDKSDAQKGNEFIAKAIGELVRNHKQLFTKFLMGKDDISAEDLVEKLKYSLPLGKLALTETLNKFKDEYQERVLQGTGSSLLGGSRDGGNIEVSEGDGGRNSKRNRQRESERLRAERGRDVVEAATNLASSLGVKLNIVESLSDIKDPNVLNRRKKRESKAWYSVTAGEVYLVLPNATSVADAQQSVLHEVVAHKGLRTLFGEQFDQFLDKVYQNADKSIRAKITNLATQNGWNFHTATEEYLASLAEDTNFEDTNPSWWAKIKELFLEMFDKIGIEVFDKVTLTDNELRYILWRSYQMQKSQGAMAVAEDVVMQQKLGVGNFRTRPAGTFDANNDDIRFRTKDEATTPSPDENADEPLSKEEKLQKDLKSLRKAVIGTKSIRKALAALVASRVRREVTDDIINVMGKSEFNALVKQIQDADVDMDIVKPLERISEIITDLNIKDKENKIFNLLSLKVQGENKSGVSIAKSVDNSTRKLFNILASDISRPKDEIRAAYEGKVDDLILNMALDISEKYQQAKSLMRDNADINNEIKDVKEENTALRKQRAELNKDGKVDEAKALGVDIQHNKEKISALEAERLANKERIEHYLGYVQRALTYSAMMGQGSYKTLMYHNMMHNVDMVNMAIRDVDTGQTLSVLRENPTRFEKAKENVRALLFSPARSLNYLLKRITVNAPNGEGRLYDYFVRGKNGYIAASENFYEGYNEFKAELNNKAKDIFGKPYKDVLADSDKPSDVTITVKSGDRVQDVQLTIGQAMYLYMVNKMADGKVKLTKMGIFDADVEAVKNSLPARYITFADWLQNKFLPKKREKYNDTHLKVFGTEMASIDGYVPMKVKKDEVYQEVDGTEQDGDRLPTTITGSIINRRRNGIILDLTTNALDLMLSHGEEMEHWNAYTPVVRDMNILLSNTKFRLMLENRRRGWWNDMDNAAKIAAGQYNPKTDAFSKAYSWASKGIISSKIAFRLWTAMKQMLSFPAFMAYSSSASYQKNLMTSFAKPYDAWKWGMENLPILHKRWSSRSLGNEKLAEVTEGTFGKILDGTAKVGMLPNAFVDALTCAIGAKAVYDYKVKEYQAQLYSKEESEYRALIDATVAFNESQQSNEGLFLSQIQANKDGLSMMVSTFNNSNFGYLRKMLEAAREMTRKKDAEVAYLRDKYIEQGMSAEDANMMAEADVNKTKRTAVLSAAMYGFLINTIWTTGSNVFKYLFTDDDDEDESLIKDVLISLGLSLVRNTAVGSWAESIVRGFAVNPSLLLGEVNTLLESIKADENKRWDKTIAYLAIKMVSSMAVGADIETLVRIYEGIEGMVADGVDVEDIMALVSAPRSQALMAAREPKENESVAEYQERMAKIDRRIDSRISDSLRGTWLKNYYMYQLADKYNLSTVRDDFGRVSIPEYQNYLDEAKVTSDREKSYKKNNIPESDMKAFRELPEYKRMTITDHYKKNINKILKDLKGDISESTRSEYEQKLYDTMGEMLEKIKELESSNK